uniref:Uncharacterized protein n=1 Tax=Oryza meridionalis TaxID=40149 RepID=A0A0E0D547_9ORYZ
MGESLRVAPPSALHDDQRMRPPCVKMSSSSNIWTDEPVIDQTTKSLDSIANRMDSRKGRFGREVEFDLKIKVWLQHGDDATERTSVGWDTRTQQLRIEADRAVAMRIVALVDPGGKP